MTEEKAAPVLDWLVLVDLRDDIMQDDLTFRFVSLEAAQAAVASWMREGHVARTWLLSWTGPKGSEDKETHEIFPLAGVKRFEIRFQPLPRRA